MYYLTASKQFKVLLIATNDYWHHIIVNKLLDEGYKLQETTEQEYFKFRPSHNNNVYWLDFKTKGFNIK